MTFNFTGFSTGLPRSHDSIVLFKEKVLSQKCKHDPVPIVLKNVAGVKFKMSLSLLHHFHKTITF